MIKVGGKIDVFVVDTMEWMSTGTLTIAAPRPRTVFNCCGCEQKGEPPTSPCPNLRIATSELPPHLHDTRLSKLFNSRINEDFTRSLTEHKYQTKAPSEIG